MPFLNLKEAFLHAQANGYALGAFNVYNLETVQSVASAAKSLNAPVIFQTTPGAIRYAGLTQLFEMIKSEIEENDLSAAIHLDHGKDFGVVKECVDIGYNTVMIDASALSYESNIALTQKVVNYSKNFGASVEAELGVISHEEGGELSSKGEYTDPGRAREFIEKTGIDSLAVSIGNEHGAPQNEKLNIELLKKIVTASNKPIVIHGASGLSRKDIRSATKAGVVKFNIDTRIRQAFVSGLKEGMETSNDPRDILDEVKTDIVKLVKDYIVLFGSENKANV